MWTLELIINIVNIDICTNCYKTSPLTEYALFSPIASNITYCTINRIQYSAFSKRNSIFAKFLIGRPLFFAFFDNAPVF